MRPTGKLAQPQQTSVESRTSVPPKRSVELIEGVSNRRRLMIRSSRCLHQQFSRSTSNHQDSAHHVRVSTGGKRKHGAVANLCRFQPLLEPVNRIRYSPLSTMEPEGDDDVIDWDTALEEIVRSALSATSSLFRMSAAALRVWDPVPTRPLPVHVIVSYLWHLVLPSPGAHDITRPDCGCALHLWGAG